MADNTTINRGTDGDVIATDDISGVKHQLVKMEFGKSDTAVQVSADDPLPVIPSNSSASFLLRVADNSILDSIKKELEKINYHLNLITEGEE